jgi:acyl carrier protein
MARNQFLLLLDELLELEPGTVKGSETLDSLEGWNSLGVISLMALVDEHFGVSLQPRQIAGCSTISDLVGLLGDRIRVEIRTQPAPGSTNSQ